MHIMCEIKRRLMASFREKNRCACSVSAASEQREHAAPPLDRQRDGNVAVFVVRPQRSKRPTRQIVSPNCLICNDLQRIDRPAPKLSVWSAKLSTTRTSTMHCSRCDQKVSAGAGAQRFARNKAPRQEYCFDCQRALSASDTTAALLWLLGCLASCGLSAGMPPVLRLARPMLS